MLNGEERSTKNRASFCLERRPSFEWNSFQVKPDLSIQTVNIIRPVKPSQNYCVDNSLLLGFG